MRIATWNVNSLRVRMPQLLQWLEANPVDLIALQEIKLTDAEFPAAPLQEAGWQTICNGQKTYNGVALLSRVPGVDVVREIPGFDDIQRRVLAATFGRLRVIDLYVPNGQEVGSEKYQYKLRWLEALREWLRQEIERHPQLLVLGDYNIAPDDRDVHDPKAWEGSVHVSEAERAALRSLFALGLEDLYRRFDQPPGVFSWWDYRAGRLPAQPRLAHRPAAGKCRSRKSVHAVPDRPRTAHLGATFRPRPGARTLRFRDAYVSLKESSDP